MQQPRAPCRKKPARTALPAGAFVEKNEWLHEVIETEHKCTRRQSTKNKPGQFKNDA